MGSLDLPQSPNVFHPEKPSAVGSRNSLAQDYRDQQKEVNQLIEEERLIKYCITYKQNYPKMFWKDWM